MPDAIKSVVFSYDRVLVLNAIYDVIDALGLTAEYTDSERGLILIRTPEQAALRLAVSTVFPSRHTQVSIDGQPDRPLEWVNALFDEMAATLAGGSQRRFG